MKKLRKNKNIKNIENWLIYIIGYTIILLLASFLFDNIYIDTNIFGIYALIASIIISVLNKTIKPVIFNLTIPITGLTLGTFYLVINFFILKLTDWCLLSHFELGNNIYAFFIAIFISLMNVIMENTVIKPLIRRLKTNG